MDIGIAYCLLGLHFQLGFQDLGLSGVIRFLTAARSCGEDLAFETGAVASTRIEKIGLNRQVLGLDGGLTMTFHWLSGVEIEASWQFGVYQLFKYCIVNEVYFLSVPDGSHSVSLTRGSFGKI